MREFELIIDEALKTGLTPEYTVPFNTQTLWDCYGYRCGKLGLEPYIDLENPLNEDDVDLHYDWPFPQYITGERYNFLIVRDPFNMEDIVYLVSNDHQTITQIFAIDELTFGQGTLMEVADFGAYAFMTNGVIMIYWDSTLGDWREVVAHANIPMMRTICNFKGQAVGGNVVSDWPSAANPQCDEKYYIWSRIGEMDFTPTRRNEEGFRRDPYGGEVYHVRKLSNVVIGYSSEGIVKMEPVIEPAPTFKFVEMNDIGLLNRGAMNGDERLQIYVGEDRILRSVTENEVVELGYQSYMEELEDGDVIVTFEPSKRNFYISDGTITYMLSPYGMTRVPQHPSAVWRRDKESYMLPDTIDAGYEAEIITEVFNMGYQGQKTIFSLETDAAITVNALMAVDWADSLDVWGYGDYRPLNDKGIVSYIVAGSFFRFRLKKTSEWYVRAFRIGYMKVRYKMTDLRGLRGVYAPPPRGQ